MIMTVEFCESIAGTGCVAELERKFAEYVGTRYAIAMSSCTAALHAALIACGVKRGDEVIAPAYTWGGSIAGALNLGAIPIFVDIDETLTISPAEVERLITRRTKAVIAVHLFGHPCDLEKLTAICWQNGVALIEDCAHAIGAKIGERHVGTFGVGCFSFSYAKSLSAGEGGMLTTTDTEVYDRGLSPVMERHGATHAWYRFSPALLPDIKEPELKEVRNCLSAEGCELESGYVAKPLHLHQTLSLYLSKRAYRQARQARLPQTDLACQTRLGVRMVC
jgi:dTDP-4-amino-4,6-dideoxygalactose transaminase